MRIVRFLGLAVVMAAAGWSLWWWSLAAGQEAAITRWFEDRRAAGWQAEHGKIAVTGFPIRLERSIAEIALADPGTAWAWQLPEIAVRGRAVSPTRIGIVFPASHRLSVPGERVDIAHDALTASLELRPMPSLPLDVARISGAGIALEAQSGWRARAVSLSAEVAERPAEAGPPNSYNIRADALDVEIPKPVLAAIDPTGLLETVVDALVIEGHAALAEPLDRFALEDGRLALRAASLKVARLAWGDVAIEARGGFEVDGRGYPVGKLKLRLKNWRRMLEIARGAGIVDGSLIDGVERALELIALLAGSKEILEVPLDLEDGKVRIGPVTVAEAPRLGPAQ